MNALQLALGAVILAALTLPILRLAGVISWSWLICVAPAGLIVGFLVFWVYAMVKFRG